MKLITAFLLLICSGFAYGQTYSLSLNLEKDHTYYVGINSSHNFSGEMEGQPINLKTSLTGRFKFKVLSVATNGYELEAGYDSMQLVIHGPMGKMEFSYPDSFSLSNTARSKPVLITLLKNGAVSKIENPDTSGFTGMLKKMPMAFAIKNMLMHSPFKKQYSKEAMQENLEKMTAVFPGKKVALNETWSNTLTPDSLTQNSIKTTYRLTGYSNGIATIQRNTIISGRDISGSTASLMQFDAATGWIKHADMKSDLQMKASTHGKIMVVGNAVTEGW